MSELSREFGDLGCTSEITGSSCPSVFVIKSRIADCEYNKDKLFIDSAKDKRKDRGMERNIKKKFPAIHSISEKKRKEKKRKEKKKEKSLKIPYA